MTTMMQERTAGGELRLESELNYLSKADGSVYLETNESFIISAVNGPVEVKIQNELVDKAYVSVAYRSLSGQPGLREKSLEAVLRSLLDGVILANLHPRTAINVNIQEVQNYGSYLACAINASCLALLDANIPLKYTFAAVTIGFSADTHVVVYFPDLEQEQKCTVLLTFVFDSVNQDLLFIDTSGIFTQKQLSYLLDNAKAYSKHMFNYYRKVISNKYARYL